MGLGSKLRKIRNKITGQDKAEKEEKKIAAAEAAAAVQANANAAGQQALNAGQQSLALGASGLLRQTQKKRRGTVLAGETGGMGGSSTFGGGGIV